MDAGGISARQKRLESVIDELSGARGERGFGVKARCVGKMPVTKTRNQVTTSLLRHDVRNMCSTAI